MILDPSTLNERFNFILASQSPRRKMLLEGLGLQLSIEPIHLDEQFPSHLKAHEIAEHLAISKAMAYPKDLNDRDILISADTIVWINDHVLNKPEDRAEAFQMLREISSVQHEVFTAFTLRKKEHTQTFVEGTQVHFNALSDHEINYYLDHFKPFDKAGSYGIQEFIGYIGIERIEGDFYNVVGFPVQRFWKELPDFLSA